jgi:hypothetical protein
MNGDIAKLILQAPSQSSHPTAAIQDDQGTVTQANFDAAGVATIT